MKIRLLLSCITITTLSLNGSASSPSSLYVSSLVNNAAQNIAKSSAAKHTTQSKEIDTINSAIAKTFAGAAIAAENTVLGPLAKLPVVEKIEKAENKLIVLEVEKGETVLEKAAENEATKIAHSAFVQKEKSLFLSWCFSDDATR